MYKIEQSPMHLSKLIENAICPTLFVSFCSLTEQMCFLISFDYLFIYLFLIIVNHISMLFIGYFAIQMTNYNCPCMLLHCNDKKTNVYLV